METHQKDKLQLLLILGSVVAAIMYINNPVIDGISFQDTIHRFLPFLSDYNPVIVGMIFIILCFAIAFFFSDKSIPKQNHDNSENQSSDVKPIVEQAETRTGHVQTHKTYNSSKPKKTMIYNYYDRKNRKRFHW